MISLGFSEKSWGGGGGSRSEEKIKTTESARMARVAFQAMDATNGNNKEKDKGNGEIIIHKSNLTYADFADLYSDEEIRGDMGYVVDAVRKIHEKAEKRGEEVDTYGAPRVLEWVASRGILTYDWLGLRGFDTKVHKIHTAAKPQDVRHCLDRYTCLSYDDSAHKIDAAFELESPDGDKVPFGLDLTIAQNSGTIWKKLRVSHNSKYVKNREEREKLESLPDGFSAIKYGYVRVSDQDSALSSHEMVPRFVVGVGADQSLRLNGLIGRAERNGIAPQKVMFDPEMIATRFKMLAEIYEQSETLRVRSRGDERSDEAREMLDVLRDSAWRSVNATLDWLPGNLEPISAPGAEEYNRKVDRLFDLNLEVADRREAGEEVGDLLKRRYELAVNIMAKQHEKVPGEDEAIARPDNTFREIIFQNRKICGSPYGSMI
ncbi:MAG: hypothetical protein Q4F60_02770 [Candidatus Saccharibacteria bacterium]|nr:hypothetical protein [Candidatus Saccharibacteria bacterium]